MFPFPMVTPPPLPIDRSLNDNSFYWYVQTTNTKMFSAFINAFSSRLRICADPLDQHGPPVMISLVLDFLCRVVFVAIHDSNKQLVRGIKLGIAYKWNCAEMLTMLSIEEAVFTSHDFLILGLQGQNFSKNKWYIFHVQVVFLVWSEKWATNENSA